MESTEIKNINKEQYQENCRIHDLRAAIRFLRNIYNEIRSAQHLQDIQDEIILEKFAQYIEIIAKEIKV